MRVTRRFLYGGLFLVAIGAVLVAADLGTDSGTLVDALSLWPLALIAVGFGLVLRHTRFGLGSGMLAAAVPGLVLGGALLVPARFAHDCGAQGQPETIAMRQGTFDGPASVSVTAACGGFTIDTAPGNAWRLDGPNGDRAIPALTTTSRSLSVGTGRGDDWWRGVERGGQAWNLTLPTSRIDELSVAASIGHAHVSLAGAQIGKLALAANASQVTVDASSSTITELSASVRVGSISIDLPDSDLVGTVRLGAGNIELCLPPTLGARVTSSGSLHELAVAGEDAGTTWESDNYRSAAHRADIHITASLGNAEINPIGGCK